MEQGLAISDLKISTDGTPIVKGVSLSVAPGSVHAIMGPNGSGKSTLAQSLMGHPKYEVTGGSVTLNGEEILGMPPNERAQKGLFLSQQYPPSLAGVSVSNFLRTARNTLKGEELSPLDFHKLLKERMEWLDMDPSFAQRNVNEGFSGGEKKRTEILQLLVLEPKFAVLDETDSGLDVDALKIVARGIRMANEKFGTGILLITHYSRILNELKLDEVHVMEDGQIVRSGGMELATSIEEQGYDNQ